MKLARRRLRSFWCAALALAVAVTPWPAAAQEPAADVDPEGRVWVFRFDFGGDQITDTHRAMLDEVARALESNPRLAAKVVGHSDSLGSEQANLQFSRLRAEAVTAYLTGDRGIAEHRIVTEAKGSLKPVASNETLEGQGRNRRVVVALRQETGAARRKAKGTWVLRFDLGGSRLSSENIALLSEVARELRYNSDLEALIVGHSDSIGQEPLNFQISRARAETAKNYLSRTLGIDEQRIVTQAKGSSRPVASNDTPEGQRRNRRAVIVLKSTRAEEAEPAAAALEEQPTEASESTPEAEEVVADTEKTSAEPLPPPSPPAAPAPAEAAAEAPEEKTAEGRDEGTPEAPAADSSRRQATLYEPAPGVRPPVLLELPEPVVRFGAKLPKTEVVVTVAVLVSPQGRVLAAQARGAQGIKSRFREAAVEAARQARFEPATRDGVPGGMWTNLAVTVPARP